MRSGYFKFALERADKIGETIDKQRIDGIAHDGGERFVGESVKNNRARVAPGGGDFLRGRGGFVGVVDKRQRILRKPRMLELRQHAAPEHFDGDAGAVGNKENRALHNARL